MAQFFVNKNQWNFKLIENKKNSTISAKWTIGAGRKKKKHNVELIRHNISSSSGPRLSQIVLDSNMIYETIDNQSQFELNIEGDEIDILIAPQNTKYYLYINGNEYNDIIRDTLAINIKHTKWHCTSCRHKNYTHSKHCRLCRRKKRDATNRYILSANPLPPAPPPSIPHHVALDINDIPPPPPLPPLSIEEKYNELLNKQTDYEWIINKQKEEILQLKQKLILSETTETSTNKETIRALQETEENKQNNAMLQFMEEIQEKIVLFEKSIHGINDMFHEIDSEKRNGLKLLQNVFNTIITNIKLRKNELVKKLETMTKIKKNILKTQCKEFKQNLKISNDLKNELQKIIDANDTNISVTKETIASKRNKFMNLLHANNIVPKVSSHLQFDFNSDYQHLLHSIATFGIISTTKLNHKTVKKEMQNMDNNYNEKWDDEIIGDHLIVSNQNSVKCMEKEVYSYRTCFGSNVASSNTHHWKLKIKEINKDFCAWNLLIGVMKLRYCNEYNDKQSKLLRKNNHFTREKSGYAFVGNLNFLTCESNKERSYGKKLKINDVIDVYLDLNKLTLCYKINNIGCGIAYKHIDKVSYCLAVSLCGTPNEIKIIKYNHETYL